MAIQDKSVAFITMGCAKNEVDSNRMLARLTSAGYSASNDPESADVVIVNTCSFIQAATEESIEAVLEVAGFESVSSGDAHLVVAGCMPARYGDDLAAELSEASGFVPCADEDNIVDVVDALFGYERAASTDGVPGLPRVTRAISGDAFAYVKISDGCDRFCAYCAIPYIRGRYHSFPEEDIMREVRELVDGGVREIVLIAQDTGRWGADFDEPSSLANLVEHLATSFAETWFRIMYIQPEGVTDELVQVVARNANVCSYFDIPFQHANKQVISAMNRKGSAPEFLDLIDGIRSKVPDAIVRTTLIAGFPGETDEQFDELCEFVEEADLDYVGVFAYSREEGTRAYDLPDQVDDDEKLDRAQRLRDLADAVCTPRVAARIGQEMDVLVCGVEEDGQLFGRAMCQAPDVDGVTYLESGEVGDVKRVSISDTWLYEMEGLDIR